MTQTVAPISHEEVEEHQELLELLAVRNQRLADKDKRRLAQLEKEWQREFASLREVWVEVEEHVTEHHSQQLSQLESQLQLLVGLPPRLSNELLAMRWTQRELYQQNRLAEATELGQAADEREEEEIDGASDRVERENAARVSAMYARHTSERKELTRRCVAEEGKLLQVHLECMDRLIADGVNPQAVREMRSRRGDCCLEVRRAMRFHCDAVLTTSAAAAEANAHVLDQHLQRMQVKNASMPRVDDGGSWATLVPSSAGLGLLGAAPQHARWAARCSSPPPLPTIHERARRQRAASPNRRRPLSAAPETTEPVRSSFAHKPRPRSSPGMQPKERASSARSKKTARSSFEASVPLYSAQLNRPGCKLPPPPMPPPSKRTAEQRKLAAKQQQRASPEVSKSTPNLGSLRAGRR
mmetsp:Transcript_16181/g.52899  ORF Transcript_16181/g.52899 Transcript_16181/m.52899 type:complete len:412 (-) Transcript_16181:136-1371(-)